MELKDTDGLCYPADLDKLTFDHILSTSEQHDLIRAYMLGYRKGYLEGKEETKKARPSGKWVTLKGDYFTPGGDPVLECPFCHSIESQHIGGVEFPIHWDFCPTCGADMRGDCEE